MKSNRIWKEKIVKALKNKTLNTVLDLSLIVAGATSYFHLANITNAAYKASRKVPVNVESAYQTKEQMVAQLNSFDNFTSDYFGARRRRIMEKTVDSLVEKYKQNSVNKDLQTEILEYESFAEEQQSKERKYGGLALASLGMPLIGIVRLCRRNL